MRPSPGNVPSPGRVPSPPRPSIIVMDDVGGAQRPRPPQSIPSTRLAPPPPLTEFRPKPMLFSSSTPPRIVRNSTLNPPKASPSASSSASLSASRLRFAPPRSAPLPPLHVKTEPTKPFDTHFKPYVPKSSTVVFTQAPKVENTSLTIRVSAPRSSQKTPLTTTIITGSSTSNNSNNNNNNNNKRKIDGLDSFKDQIEPVRDEADNMDNPNDILLDESAQSSTSLDDSQSLLNQVSRKELDHHDGRDRARMLRIACLHEGLKAALAHWYKKRPVPFLNGVQLHDYQVRIMNWMALREKFPVHGIRGGFVAPEMGLGKTITVSAYCLWSERPVEGPTLIVASLNVLGEWRKHFANFYEPEVLEKRVVFLHKQFNPQTESLCRADLEKVDIVLTTYEMVQSSYRNLVRHFPDDADSCIIYRNDETRKQILAMNVRTADSVRVKAKIKGVNLIHQGIHWGRLVCDESQTIANPTTKGFRAIMAVAAPRRWGISGTMVRNYVHDIWAQLRYAGYDKVSSKRLWTRTSAPRYYNVHGLSAVIYALTYEQAGVTLPPFHEETIHVELTGREREVYDLVEAKARKTYQLVIQKKLAPGSVRAMVTRLRQCCIGATLMNGHGAIDALLGDSEVESFLHAEYDDDIEDSSEDDDGDDDGDDDVDGSDEDDSDEKGVRASDELEDGEIDVKIKQEGDANQQANRGQKRPLESDLVAVKEDKTVTKTTTTIERPLKRPKVDDPALESTLQAVEAELDRMDEEEQTGVTPKPERSLFRSNKEVFDFCSRVDGEGGIRSAKIKAAVEAVERHMARGPQHKIICFSMFTKALELLIQALSASPALSEVGIVMIDGQVVGDEREAFLANFRDDPKNRILCIQGKVGGEGLNLQFATGGLALEPHWTYQAKKQQRRRFWRRGQTEATWWYDIIVDDTIEQRVIKICEEKIKIEEDFQNRKRGRLTKENQTNFYGKLLGL